MGLNFFQLWLGAYQIKKIDNLIKSPVLQIDCVIIVNEIQKNKKNPIKILPNCAVIHYIIQKINPVSPGKSRKIPDILKSWLEGFSGF
jgi:hypothetical protein